MRVIVPAAEPDDGVFTRASIGTYIDETGVLRTSNVDQPRYQDGLLLLEAAASNLLQYSEDMRNTAEAGSSRPWSQFDDTSNAVAVSLVTTTKPDGTSGTVSKVTANTTGAVQRQVLQFVSGLADGAVVTFSVFLRAAEVPRASLVVTTKAPAYPSVTFDLMAGTIATSSGVVAASGITALSGGWYRCWMAVNVGTGASSPSANVLLINASNTNYGGSIGDGLFVWGAQLEVASAPTSYIPRTGTAAGSRAAESFSGEYMVSFAGTVVGLPIQVLDEDSTAAWVSGTTYAVGAKVHRPDTHRVYRRAVAGAGTTPPESDPTNWQDIMPTQRWAPLALAQDTYAIALGNIYFTLVTADDGVGLLLGGIRAESVRVVALAPPFSSVAFDQTYTMPPQSSTYSTGNEPVLAVGLPSDLPAGSQIHITLIAFGVGALKYSWLRYLAVGKSYTLGGTLKGSRIGIADYSRKETDEFGTTTLVQRGYAKRLSLEMTLPNSQVQSTFAVLADLRATPAMWVPADGSDLSWLATYGWLKDWGITVQYSRSSLCSLEIEGLI